MRTTLLFCLLAAAVRSGVYGWKPGVIYEYALKTCACVHDPYLGDNTDLLLISNVYIQPFSNDKLSVTGFKFRNDSSNGVPFGINFKNGLVTSLIVNRNLRPGSDAQIIAKQLQLDLQGERCIEPKPCQLPKETNPVATYQIVENSIYGVFETQYEVSPSL